MAAGHSRHGSRHHRACKVPPLLEVLVLGVRIAEVSQSSDVRVFVAAAAAAVSGDEADDLVRVANFFKVFKVGARVAFIVIVV